MKNKLYPLSGTLVLTLMASVSWAQNAGQAANPDMLKNTMGDYLLIMGALVIIVAMAVLFRLASMLMEMQKIQLMREHGIEVMKESGLLKEPFWQRLQKKWTKAVPLEKEKDILFDHEYDGIYELDNSLPPWWVALFYITIAFAVIYFGYYHVTGYGESQHETFTREMAEAEEQVQEFLAQQADLVDETNVELLSDVAALDRGKTIFVGSCATCHMEDGGGGVGPNLTDEYWIHGGDIKDLFKTIKYGVPEKGMISWRSQLRASQMAEVASYILTLQGTTPANPKEPQGELFQAEKKEATPSEKEESSKG